MDNIKEFITEFINKEFECQKAKWDIRINDQEVFSFNKKLETFTHSYFSYTNFERTGYEFGDEDDLILAAKKMNKFIPRTLFQIKQYQNFKLGDSLLRIVTGNDLYACYVSYESDNGMPLDYSDIFYITETNEGLKIIYNMKYGVKNREWRHSHELEALQVINNGNLVAVKKYQAPVEETSLADYNRE